MYACEFERGAERWVRHLTSWAAPTAHLPYGRVSNFLAHDINLPRGTDAGCVQEVVSAGIEDHTVGVPPNWHDLACTTSPSRVDYPEPGQNHHDSKTPLYLTRDLGRSRAFQSGRTQFAPIRSHNLLHANPAAAAQATNSQSV